MKVTVIFIWLAALIGISWCAEKTEYLKVESFAVGQCVEVDYTAPTTGRTTVQLSAAAGTIVLTADYRKKWGGNPSTGKPWTNILILNSKIGGKFGKEQHVEGIETTPGSLMAWRICAKDKDFSIVLNGKELTTYAYRTPVTTVTKLMFTNRNYDSVVQKMCVTFS